MDPPSFALEISTFDKLHQKLFEGEVYFIVQKCALECSESSFKRW